MNNSTRYPHLLKCDFMRDLPAARAREFLDSGKVLTMDIGQEILTQGEPSQALYMIVHGVTEICYGSENGDLTVIGYDGAGGVLGELELLAELPCVATCRAFRPVVLLEFSRQTFLRFMREPAFLRNFARLQNYRLERDNREKAADHFFTVDQRLCDRLLSLSRYTTTISQSQAALANSLGCTRQTVNKELNSLKSDGIIEIHKGRIEVLDRERLVDRIPTLA